MNTLVIPQWMYDQAKCSLLDGHVEHCGFFACETVKTHSGNLLVCREFHRVETEDLDAATSENVVVSDQALLRLINYAIRNKFTLVEAHSHPKSSDLPAFSLYDERNLVDFVPHMLASLVNRPYAATVWGHAGATGWIWNPAGERSELRILCAGAHTFRADLPLQSVTDERFDRQAKFLGVRVQTQLAQLRIALVGLGGLGSHMVQQLAYMGARDLLVIDDDVIEQSNLNRLVGATPEDVSVLKTRVAQRQISGIAPEAHVVAVGHSVLDKQTRLRLREADIVVAGVDNDGVRLFLNRFCKALHKPYIDVGSEITVHGGVVTSIGGRCNVVLPGGPCLQCMNEIDAAEARFYFLSEYQKAKAQDLGYGIRAEGPVPSIVNLNGTVASGALFELQAMLSGLRPPHPAQYYEAFSTANLHQHFSARRVRRRPHCYTCSLEGTAEESL